MESGIGEAPSDEEINEEGVDGEGDEIRDYAESEFEDFRRWLRNLRK